MRKRRLRAANTPDGHICKKGKGFFPVCPLPRWPSVPVRVLGLALKEKASLGGSSRESPASKLWLGPRSDHRAEDLSEARGDQESGGKAWPR